MKQIFGLVCAFCVVVGVIMFGYGIYDPFTNFGYIIKGGFFMGCGIGFAKILDSSSSSQSHDSTNPDDVTIPCPFCAEDIKAAAKVCKHCGRDIVHV